MTTVPRAVVALLALALVVGFASCGRSEADGTVVRIPVREVVSRIDDGRYTVIDVRTPREYDAGHLAGAVNIDSSAPDFEDRVAELDNDVPYAVYGRDKEHSAPAADAMVRLGVEQIVDAGSFGLLALAGARLEG